MTSTTTVSPPEVTTTTTTAPPIQEFVCSGPGFFGNPNDCSKFYRCVESMSPNSALGSLKPINYDCQPGTIFDPRISSCNYPVRVNPKPECWKMDDGALGERGGSTTSAPATQEPITENIQIPTNEEGAAIRRSSARPSISGQLEVHVDPDCYLPGTFGDNHNCSRFYKCLPNRHGNFSLLWRECPKSKIFDPASETCKRAREVNPKPPCWAKTKLKKHVIRVDEFVEVFDAEEGHESHSATSNEDSAEHTDDFESAGIGQTVALASGQAAGHVRRTNFTTSTVEETEVHEVGTIRPSVSLKGRKTRITIPKPEGVRPLPHCESEGTFPHPTECSKYLKCIRKGGNGPIKLYRYPCNPTGLIFDPVTALCKEPKAIRPVPSCVPWDETFRLIFEEILNAESEVEEIGVQGGRETTTISPRTPQIDNRESTDAACREELILQELEARGRRPARVNRNRNPSSPNCNNVFPPPRNLQGRRRY